MLRLSCKAPSAAVAGVASAATALQRVAVRRFEYPALGMSWRTPKHAQGEQLASTYEWGMIKDRDPDARALTGNADLTAYDAATMYSPEADVAKLSQKYSYMKGHTQYALDYCNARQVTVASELFAKCDKGAMWAALLKDYPSLATPLDDETKAKIVDMYTKGLPLVMSEPDAVMALCLPVVRELLETKCLSQPYWWRIQEKAVAAMCAEGCAAGVYDQRAAHLVTERFTKLLYNTWKELPWASEDYVSPLMTDVCGARVWTEAGHW